MKGAHGKLIQEFPALKIPLQCPLVLLAKVGWEDNETLGIEEGKTVGIGLLWVLNRGKQLSMIIIALDRNFDNNTGISARETCSAK